jgi:hypothetical protein
MIILPLGLTSEEIRVLQEFRRLNAESLTAETIKALKHPSGVTGDAPAVSLADKGWLTIDGPRENYALTEKSREFLAIEAKPMFEEAPSGPSQTAVSAAENPQADGV